MKKIENPFWPDSNQQPTVQKSMGYPTEVPDIVVTI
jgi:hypothetical protein